MGKNIPFTASPSKSEKWRPFSGEALAAAGASAGVPPACIRDQSAPGMRSEPRTPELLCLRHEPLSHPLRHQRSQAGKRNGSKEGMRRQHEKKVAIDLQHQRRSHERTACAGLMNALQFCCAVLCLCRVV